MLEILVIIAVIVLLVYAARRRARLRRKVKSGDENYDPATLVPKAYAVYLTVLKDAGFFNDEEFGKLLGTDFSLKRDPSDLEELAVDIVKDVKKNAAFLKEAYTEHLNKLAECRLLSEEEAARLTARANNPSNGNNASQIKELNPTSVGRYSIYLSAGQDAGVFTEEEYQMLLKRHTDAISEEQPIFSWEAREIYRKSLLALLGFDLITTFQYNSLFYACKKKFLNTQTNGVGAEGKREPNEEHPSIPPLGAPGSEPEPARQVAAAELENYADSLTSMLKSGMIDKKQYKEMLEKYRAKE